MVVDRYREALVGTQFLQQNVVEGIESSWWHVVRLREKGEKEKDRKEREREREREFLNSRNHSITKGDVLAGLTWLLYQTVAAISGG